MFRNFSIAVVIGLLCFLGASCQQTIPDAQFDARMADQTLRSPNFTKVKINRSPDKKLLSPPTEAYLLDPIRKAIDLPEKSQTAQEKSLEKVDPKT